MQLALGGKGTSFSQVESGFVLKRLSSRWLQTIWATFISEVRHLHTWHCCTSGAVGVQYLAQGPCRPGELNQQPSDNKTLALTATAIPPSAHGSPPPTTELTGDSDLRPIINEKQITAHCDVVVSVMGWRHRNSKDAISVKKYWCMCEIVPTVQVLKCPVGKLVNLCCIHIMGSTRVKHGNVSGHLCEHRLQLSIMGFALKQTVVYFRLMCLLSQCSGSLNQHDRQKYLTHSS